MKRTKARPAEPASESEVIGRLRQLFDGADSRRVATVGIGDDAAVLRPVKDSLVWTVDVSVERVHFDRRWLSLDDIGARSFHAAASDLAAMGAKPVAALSSLVVPARLGSRNLEALARGQADASRALRCPIVGGNLSRGSELSVTTTLLGSAKTPTTRSGGVPGDEVWLVGDVGLAAAGLSWLRRRGRKKAAAAARACVEAWRRPRALVPEGLLLAGKARAVIDVSDGLAGDAGHLARASGVRVVFEQSLLERALRKELFALSRMLGRSALDFALYGGEDYALLATGSARKRPKAARPIGRVESGSGVLLERAGGATERLGGGFDHFH